MSDPEVLAAAVAKVLAAIAGAEVVPLADRLAYSETEAAALIGCEPHVLRDERLRRNINAKKVGRRIYYTRKSLVAFLTA